MQCENPAGAPAELAPGLVARVGESWKWCGRLVSRMLWHAMSRRAASSKLPGTCCLAPAWVWVSVLWRTSRRFTPVSTAQTCVAEIKLPVGEVCLPQCMPKPPMGEIEAMCSVHVATDAHTCICMSESIEVAPECEGMISMDHEVETMCIGKPSVTDGFGVKLKLFPHVIIDSSPVWGEPTGGGEQRALHVRVCMSAVLCMGR